MQIWEASSPAMLVFSQHDVSTDYLGACVEDVVLQQGLWKNLLEEDCGVSILTCCALESFQVLPFKMNLIICSSKSDLSESESTENPVISTNLLIAADGAQSPIRNKLGISFSGVDYGRTAVTFTVELDKDVQHRRAYQRFLPEGPIALLPTHSSRHAVVVWSTTPELAQQLKDLETIELVRLINDTLQQGPQRLEPLVERQSGISVLDNLTYGFERVLDTLHYGMGMKHWSDDPSKFAAPPRVANVVSPRFAFPLSCKLASHFASTEKRVALIGDAAHTVHPLAGQGLNLGLDDVAALTKVVQKAHDAGMDAAQFLHEYHVDRLTQIPLRVGGNHMLHTLFGMRSTPLLHGKSIGMSLVNQVGPLRRQLAKIATGLE
jgi:ubiquinone biosynthesis UbiH/UbiF/VisC/COQ6 family hydroxylase